MSEKTILVSILVQLSPKSLRKELIFDVIFDFHKVPSYSTLEDPYVKIDIRNENLDPSLLYGHYMVTFFLEISKVPNFSLLTGSNSSDPRVLKISPKKLS